MLFEQIFSNMNFMLFEGFFIKTFILFERFFNYKQFNIIENLQNIYII